MPSASAGVPRRSDVQVTAKVRCRGDERGRMSRSRQRSDVEVTAEVRCRGHQRSDVEVTAEVRCPGHGRGQMSRSRRRSDVQVVVWVLLVPVISGIWLVEDLTGAGSTVPAALLRSENSGRSGHIRGHQIKTGWHRQDFTEADATASMPREYEIISIRPCNIAQY